MTFARAEVLSAAQRSLTAAAARDRSGWVGLFTADARVQDPVGSTPHRGHVALGRFYDTFIGPREITHQVETDVVVGATVVRDVTLEIQMASALTLRVPTYIRYDMRTDGDQLKIAALSAYWELPAMVGQFARAGCACRARRTGPRPGDAGPSGPRRAASGFLRGFGGAGAGASPVAARFLDDVCGGNEVGVRRMASAAAITFGDDEPLSAAELLRELAGGRWDKLVRSGHAVAARVERDGLRTVMIGELGPRGPERAALNRIRLFGELR